jgi:serine/threonine protein kinase
MNSVNMHDVGARGSSDASASAVVPHAGQVVGDRYRLEEPLERGAMGSIWRAEHVRLRAPVAVKFLDPSLIGDTEMLDRFMQEARSAAAVRSAHVVQVFDYGSEGGVPYLTMELLEGENLDMRLTARGKLTPAELNKIFTEVARGIGKAHAMGVVHRDLKPGNIFIAREGEYEITKLVDFGIAKVDADALKFTQIVGTQLGTLLGTPQYMSPEQVRGSSSVDYRTDLWALAIIACECLTGRCPFPGTTLGDLTIQICTEKPRAPSALGEVPPGFDQWFFKATRKRASKRFGSVEEMTAALTQILAMATSVSTPKEARARRLFPSRRDMSLGLSALSEGLRQLFARMSYPLLRLMDPFTGVDSDVATQKTLAPSNSLAPVESKRYSGWAVWSQRRLLGSALLALVCGLVLVGLSDRGARGNVGALQRQARAERGETAAPPEPAVNDRMISAERRPSELVMPALPAASDLPPVEAPADPPAPLLTEPTSKQTAASGAKAAAHPLRAQPAKAHSTASRAKAQQAAPKPPAAPAHPFDDRL